MNNIQINGQRRWGPPENWLGPPPPHGTEIFVKNLPQEVFELELYEIFSAAGIVYEVRLPVNWSGLNRGYAFLRFTTLSAADEAIDVFDNYEIRKNRRIKVARSLDNTRLFLSSVPTDKNAEDLKRSLLNYVENVRKVYVYPTLENRSVFRGYAFVEFETHRDAAIAKRVLTPDVCQGIFERKCVAAWANPLPFLDHSILKSVNVLFIRNIPKDISNFQLKKIVQNLTRQEVQRIKKLNDFAFLTFKDHKSAEIALTHLKNAPIVILNHETQAEWAVPREMVASQPEKKCQDSGTHYMRSEGSNCDFPLEFKDATPHGGYDMQSPSRFRNDPPTMPDCKNDIFELNTTGNGFQNASETLFCANRLENIQARMRNQDGPNPYYDHQKICENDISPLNVPPSPVMLENGNFFHSCRSSVCHSTNISVPKSSPEHYSRPLPIDNLLQISQGKSHDCMELYGQFNTRENLNFLDTMKNRENIGNPLQGTHNPESDSDESTANINWLGISPSSAMTNWSSGTVSQTFSSDEQDFHPQSPVGECIFGRRRRRT